MKTNAVLFAAALCACLVAGSSHASAQKLYPVQGPLSAQTPPPVFAGNIRRPMFAAGPVFNLLKSWKLSDGDVLLQSKPKPVMASAATPMATGAISLPLPNLAFAWDAVYGDGFFAAHILGKKFGQAVFTGSQGTVLQVETLDGKNGVAVDNRGNTYKMVW